MGYAVVIAGVLTSLIGAVIGLAGLPIFAVLAHVAPLILVVAAIMAL